MKGHLIQIDARDGAGAATRYLASVDDPLLCHLNGQQWVPAIAALPSLRYDFFGGDFNGAITTPGASFSVAIEGISTFTALRWSGARVRIYTGNVGDAWGSFTLRFDGRVNAEPTLNAGIARFDSGPDDSWLDKPLLTLFAGTGGVEGPTDLTGAPKPVALGSCRFAPGVLIDATNNVYCVSAYAVEGITAAHDRVVALGSSTGNYADLAALLAAALPAGGWGTCKALGLVRLGAPADGLVSFHVSGDNAGAGGYARRPGAMIRRLASIAGGTVNTANLAALDTARPYDLALVMIAQTTAREMIQSLADSVCAVAGITLTGTLFVKPLGYTASSLTLKSDGTALPPVASVEVRPVAAPFWRLATEAEPTWVVHDPANVATEYNLRGLYSASRVYRLDDVVVSADGSAWVYINTTSAAGNAPPTWPTTSNSHWTTVNPATSPDFTNVTGGTKPSDNATVGARVGINFLDQAGAAIATDAAIKNSAITINAAGTLSGAGAGSVTIGGLGYLGVLNATANPDLALNLNTNFYDWPTGSIFPTGILNNQNQTGSNTTRIAGTTSQYAMRVVATGGTDFSTYFDIGSTVASRFNASQFVMLEVDIFLEAGVLTSAGFILSVRTPASSQVSSHRVSFDTDKDTSGAVPGAGVVGREYTFRKMVQVGSGAELWGRCFIQTSSAPNGSNATGRTIVWRRIAVTAGDDTDVKTFGQDIGATLGARSGTNIFRTDGTTILTQAEIRTLEGVASSVTGQAITATNPDFAGINGVTRPENNADVTSTIEGAAEVVVLATSAGVPMGGQLPKTSGFKLWRNGVDVTTSATWSLTVLTGTFTATIGGATGVLNLDVSGGNFTSGTIRLTSVYLGLTRTKSIVVTRSDAQATNSGGSNPVSVSGAINGAVSSTTMVAVSAELTVAVGAVGTVTLAAPYEFTITDTTSGPRHVHAQWYEWNGSAYVALGTETQSTSAARWIPSDLYHDSGFGGKDQTVTGKTANSTGHKYTLYGRCTAGTITRFFSGTATAVGT